MNILAIIPARGGSRGIPQKNLQILGGKTLLARSIDAARAANDIQRIVVSTDCNDIAAEAIRQGAEVVRRPAEISTSLASSEAALLHALGELRAASYVPDLVVFLQCTAPLTAAEDITGTIKSLTTEQADTAFAAVPSHFFLWRTSAEKGASGVNHDKSIRPMRQQREPEFVEAGAVYVMKTEGFIRARHRFFGKTAIYAMSPHRWLEIDEPTDLVRAKALLGIASQ